MGEVWQDRRVGRRERRWSYLGLRLIAGGMLALCSAGCGSTSTLWQAPAVYWDAELTQALLRARRLHDNGQVELAWQIVAPASSEHPSDLDLAVWLQELRAELLLRNSPLDPALHEWLDLADPNEALRKFYAAEARARPTPVQLILAARTESDAIAAITLLDRALELDPTSPWVHYGRAHALLLHKGLIKRWELAREALQRALSLDPSFLRARRLQAWMLANEGSVRSARNALETWLERVQDDVRVAASERTEAEVDLALLRVLDGDTAGARELCRALEGNPIGRARRLAVEAVAAAERGEVLAAFEAARRAADAAPHDVTPLVQQALLQQYWLQDKALAEALWHQIVLRAGQSPDLGTLLQGMRAQIYLEREQATGQVKENLQ